ncbi:hypothetical protein [Streptomyces sporangiiformans]|uniref:Uncharacterized protein n=1 Tax=Streptomyces sporangiiformans TaxID=2315329 RepID=A0A505DRY9_9ACTN|nr:hypothetical protein [Streptomyces sporangiiformans]TPQ23772.1 hypothetical protein FGD71_002155 [Streptomyces sporangiiformans]
MPAPHGHRRTGPPLLLLTALAITLSGCTGSGPGGSDDFGPEPTVASTPAKLRTQGLKFPLDAYERSTTEQRVLTRAQQMLTNRCMARYGFAFQAPATAVTPGDSTDDARRYGVSDPETAAAYGYARPNKPGSTRTPPRQPELSSTGKLVLYGASDDGKPQDLPASQQEAEAVRKKGKGTTKVGGEAIPVGGCIRESFLKLYAPTRDSVDVLFVFQLISEAQSRSREDSRVRRVFKRWSSCMKESGYSVSNPAGVASQLGLRDDELSSPRAITAAKADVACKEKVNLVGVTFAVESAYQRQLINKNAETLQLVKKQDEDRLRFAASLTAA